MGRCVIFALGEILISVLSAATWMDEPGSLQPRLTFPQHLTQPSRSHGGRSDACDQQVIVFLSSSLIDLVTLNLMEPGLAPGNCVSYGLSLTATFINM